MTELESISHIAFLVFYIIVILGTLMLLSLLERYQRTADRYRLKYGFDREIEKKEPKGFNESSLKHQDKLNEREQRFKRRVFKD